MYCYYCGKEIVEDAVFCRYCGRKQINDDDDTITDKCEEEQPPIPEGKDAGDQPDHSILTTVKDSSKKKKKTIKIVCIIVAAVLLLLAAFPIYRIIRADQIRRNFSAGGPHYFIGSAVGTYWQQSTLESELLLCSGSKNDTEGSSITFGNSLGSVTRPITWEINNDVNFIITYTDGEDERIIYTYSEKDKENEDTWFFDKETDTLYLGDRKYHPVGINDLRFPHE